MSVPISPPKTPILTTSRHGSTSAAASDGAFDLPRRNLSWLLRLRWGAMAGQMLTILFVERVMGIALPLVPLFAILGLELVSNIACIWWARRRVRIEESVLALLMAFDTLLLTALLQFTGGPFNPFSSLYLVHIALAAVALRLRWTWSLVTLSLAGFGSLFLGHLWLSAPSMVNHATQMRMHLQGMWVAFGITAIFIAYFVTRATRNLAEREIELSRARALALDSERLASLGTLAAGAAHELRSPLSTIAIVAKELERQLASSELGAEVLSDIGLIRTQVERCCGILDQMAVDAGQNSGEGFVEVKAADLLREAIDEFADKDRIRIELDRERSEPDLLVPRRAVAQALRAVVKNALEASPAGNIVVAAVVSDEQCEFLVEDRGHGMVAEILARAGEPFFTTKEPGAGMGLGLFLSRAVIDRLGGALTIDSIPTELTRVRLTLPRYQRGNLPHWSQLGS